MKKLKKLLKIGTLITMTALGGCSGEKQNDNETLDFTIEKWTGKQIPREEALSHIQYHKKNKKQPIVNKQKQKD